MIDSWTAGVIYGAVLGVAVTAMVAWTVSLYFEAKRHRRGRL